MKTLRYFFSFFYMIILALHIPLYGQSENLKFDRLSIEDGLSQSAVYTIIRDRQGFMWIGTKDGLNKYDGYGFTIYRHNPLDPHSLSDNWITTLHEDEGGALWIGTIGGGISKLVSSAGSGQALSGTEGLDRERHRFIHYRHDPNNPASLSRNVVWEITEDRDGIMWVGTLGAGLDRFDRTTGVFTHFRNEPGNPASLSGNSIWKILEDRFGNL